MSSETKNKGFKVIEPERQKEIAAQGGKSLVAKRGIEYMREIGKRGGTKSRPSNKT
jgi:general stress protein YciG